MGHRHARLTDRFIEELRAIFRHDVENPLLTEVNVSAVELTADYRNVRVHLAVRATGTRREIEAALARSTPFVRGRLAEAIELKRVPEIRFVIDVLV